MGYDNMSHRREPRHMDKHRETTAQKLLHRKRQSKSSIPVVAVADLMPAPPRTAAQAVAPTMPYSRSGRRGFWTVKQCVVCGGWFDLRQHPNKAPNRRVCCDKASCINENKWRKAAARMQRIKDRMAIDPDFAADVRTGRTAQVAAWRENNPAQYKATQKAHAIKHRERNRINGKAYRKNNPEKMKEKNRLYNLNNRDKINAHKRKVRSEKKAIKNMVLAAGAYIPAGTGGT